MQIADVSAHVQISSPRQSLQPGPATPSPSGAFYARPSATFDDTTSGAGNFKVRNNTSEIVYVVYHEHELVSTLNWLYRTSRVMNQNPTRVIMIRLSGLRLKGCNLSWWPRYACPSDPVTLACAMPLMPPVLVSLHRGVQTELNEVIT